MLLRLRWIAREIGFEKMFLKNERMTGYFVSNQESPFYQSEKFAQVLNFVQNNPAKCRMKEAKDKLSLTFYRIKTIEDALRILRSVDPVEV